MDNMKKLELEKIACKIRMGVVEGTHNAKSGHPGGSLSIADILSYLYFTLCCACFEGLLLLGFDQNTAQTGFHPAGSPEHDLYTRR